MLREPLSRFITGQSFICCIQLLEHLHRGVTPKGLRVLVHTLSTFTMFPCGG
jgi:hypothetical protein